MKEYKINIRPQDCKFFVYEEKRKVVCLIDGTEWRLLNFLRNYTTNVYADDDDVALSRSYVGVATCAPEDEWNEEFGKRLAFHKAKMKFDESFFKHAQRVVNRYDTEIGRIISGINKYGEQASGHAEKRDKKITNFLEKNKEES